MKIYDLNNGVRWVTDEELLRKYRVMSPNPEERPRVVLAVKLKTMPTDQKCILTQEVFNIGDVTQDIMKKHDFSKVRFYQEDLL